MEIASGRPLMSSVVVAAAGLWVLLDVPWHPHFRYQFPLHPYECVQVV